MGIIGDWINVENGDDVSEIKHRASKEEISFYQAVATGDVSAVRKNCEEHRFTEPEGVGTLSRDPVQNLKYHFVVTTALVTRLCIEKGLNEEQAYRLSDFYIIQLDNIHTLAGVAKLHDDMVTDFTGKMRLLQKDACTSKPITECINYIYIHRNDRILIEELADHVGLTPSYLSRLFKDEIGISVSSYIREKKIEAAENMLKYSDADIVEISNKLSFSSQSHFIQTFKKLVGVTPKQYRKEHGRSSWEVQ